LVKLTTIENPSSNLPLLARLQNSLLDGLRPVRDVVESGPFTLLLDPNSDFPWSNYAFPVRPSSFRDDDIKGMIQAFRENGRKPRLEFFPDLAPGLKDALARHAFRQEMDLVVMVCRLEDFRPYKGDLLAELLTPESDIAAYAHMVDRCYDSDQEVSPERVERMRTAIAEERMKLAQVEVDGELAAGAGLYGKCDVPELAAVGTLEKFRRRGAASAACSKLLETHFRENDLVWLSAADARTVYEKLGFFVVGSQLNYILD
jgi:hypothetical protein